MWYEVPDARPENLRSFSDPISHVAYTESDDGITWNHPPKVLPNHFRDKDFNDAVRLSVVRVEQWIEAYFRQGGLLGISSQRCTIFWL